MSPDALNSCRVAVGATCAGNEKHKPEEKARTLNAGLEIT